MKYRLTEERKRWDGATLHRIEAVKSFGPVKAGDKGGYIEKEENLSHAGNAWVYGDAQVYGYAQVSGNARVCGDAWVAGNARVSGDAQVYGDAWVYGNARVSGDARVCGDAQVSRNAQVCGYAQVSGNARVCGDAQVYGYARVCGDAKVYGDAWETSPLYIQGIRYSVCASGKRRIRIGCQDHSIEKWLRHGEEIAERYGVAELIPEYREYVLLFARRYAPGLLEGKNQA